MEDGTHLREPKVVLGIVVEAFDVCDVATYISSNKV